MTVLTRGAFPAFALLHERLRAAHVARLPAVPRVDGAGAHAADVRREEYIQPSQTTTKKCDRSREEMCVTAFASNTLCNLPLSL